MNRIEREIELLLEKSAAGELPRYPEDGTEDSFYSEAPVSADMTEYFSGENDALERKLQALWAHEPQLRSCIPLILAAVEKNRGQSSNAVVPTELYNYTM